jgi:hypothetical protein
MQTLEKQSNYREDFPGYQGHVPYKYSIIGKTVGATNETIKELLSTEPPKETFLQPGEKKDFSYYDRDYYCDNFNRDYPLEEDKIFSNKSKEAETWISGDKYKIYPQHIPGVNVHVPGIYSSNIYGLPFSKATAVSIKGDYNKEQNCSDKERFTSTAAETFKKPKTRSFPEEAELEKHKKYAYTTTGFYDPYATVTTTNILPNGRKEQRQFINDIRRIYHSKIAQVPTVGYAGTQSIFQKQISYLNYDKIMEAEKKSRSGLAFDVPDDLPQKFKEALKTNEYNPELPYVVGYKGFRVGVKSGNYHGENFHDSSLRARTDFKLHH